jgi:lipopolysaccharide/colanic/teichoic acid biosynthesis glycosyltransferase
VVHQGAVEAAHRDGLPLLALPHTNPHSWQFATKHLSDRNVAGLGLLVLSPAFVVVMVLVRASSPDTAEGPMLDGMRG